MCLYQREKGATFAPDFSPPKLDSSTEQYNCILLLAFVPCIRQLFHSFLFYLAAVLHFLLSLTQVC